MKLTIGDALKLQPLCLGNMIAGGGGADREIRSVTVIELPDKSEFYEPHLLAISSLSAVANNVEEQLNLVRLLNKFEGCGLIIFNVGLVLPGIDSRLIDLCNEINFPLINMPQNISYYQVIEAVMDQLLERQSRKLEASMKLYEALMDQLLDSSGNYSAMFGILSKYINNGILFFNHNQKCVYASMGMPEVHIQQFVREISAGMGPVGEGTNIAERPVEICGVSYLLVPVINNRAYYGTIVVVGTDCLTDLERLALSQTKKALCVAAFGNVRMDEHYKRLKIDFLRDLLQGNYGNESLIVSQGRELELDVQNIGCVIVVSPYSQGSGEGREQMLEHIFLQAKRVMPEGIVALFEEKSQVVILCNKTLHDNFLQPARVISVAVEASCGFAPSVGVGPPCSSIGDISRSYTGAMEVILLTGRIFGEPRCESYADMQIYGLLYDSISPEGAERIIDTMLEPLRRYDKTYNTNLEQTFYQLLYNNGSTAQVADIMYLHKNTVLQRKNKISGLYKGDPFSSPERLQFELAFLLQKIFDLREEV